jgi:hypothetical protein
MTQKKGTGVLMATTQAMGYEAQTTRMKDTKKRETKKVLEVKTRGRETSYSESNQKT